MPDLTDFPALDVAIGLAFMYFLLSIVCSSVQEAIATVFKLRAQTLEKGIRTLIADQAKADAFYENWRIKALMTPRWFRKKAGRRPSYIPSRTFALSLIDTLVPDADPYDSADVLSKATATVNRMDGDAVGRKMLLDAIVRAQGKLNVFRGEIEDTFNATMDRATGWYKRKVQVILFVVALTIAGGLNADTFNVAQRLFQDDALRAQVVTQAVQASEGEQPQAPEEVTATTVEDQLKQARATALPFGWSAENVPDAAKSWDFVAWLPAALLKIAGLLVTAFALTLGAPFWFDVLGRFAKLRSSGNRIGTPKDDETAPVDRDERVAARTEAGSAPPPSIAEVERRKNAAEEAKAQPAPAPQPQRLEITVQAAPPG